MDSLDDRIEDGNKAFSLEQEIEEIWAEVTRECEGYISSDLKAAAKAGIRMALERHRK